jgi:hypothetical protein
VSDRQIRPAGQALKRRMPNDSRKIALGAATLAALLSGALVGAPDAAAAPLQVRPPTGPLRLASSRSRYTIDLVDDAGRQLDTYRDRGRFYVLGEPGQRYSVRVTNPTGRRIEAVVSIDGLDVIDGEDADYVHKRGYIVAPHDTLVVDGFRTSTPEVASFRFSSVAASYAGRKGKARNVGVVGVAIFEEAAPPVAVMPMPVRPGPRRRLGLGASGLGLLRGGPGFGRLHRRHLNTWPGRRPRRGPTR